VSRVCEEFSCLPSQAERELDNDTGLLFDILGMRAFSGAWRDLEAAIKNDKLTELKLTPAHGKVVNAQKALLLLRQQEREQAQP
jgi:hypothetical protein